MDQMVLKVQQWLNKTYTNRHGYNPIEENGLTGWNTIYALTRALQIEEGIAEPTDNFGPTTTRLCPTLRIQPENSSPSNYIYILQGALWCKGYNPTGFSGNFYSGTEAAIKKFQSDAGLSIQDGVATPMIIKALLNMDAFILVPNGDFMVRKIQQNLNRDYLYKIELMPCDGVYARATSKALIYALQIEEGISEPNGNFGPSTTSLCPILYLGVTKPKFVLILQYALYCNGYNSGEFDGVYDTDVETAVRNFQSFSCLPSTGTADVSTWKSLLISCGDTSRPGTACDCATPITPERAATLIANGYTIVGRYITGTSKKITANEIQIILNAGLKFFPIYQTSGDAASYFTVAQGRKDAYNAIVSANSFGFPTDTIIYFAVDFDAYDYQVTENILPYFKAIKDKFNDMQNKYRIGIYGSRNICRRAAQAGYTCSSFVSDMSTGYSGNLGYPLPPDWAFDQIITLPLHVLGNIEIDKNISSGRDAGIGSVKVPTPPTSTEALKELDKNILSGSYYYCQDYNNNHDFTDQVGNDINDYNFLMAMQTIYIYYLERNDYEKLDVIFEEMCKIRKLQPTFETDYAGLINDNNDFDIGYSYYAKGRKTAKFRYNGSRYFTKDVIVQMHQVDDWLAFLTSLIPGVGTELSILMSLINKYEQSGEITLFDISSTAGDALGADRIIAMIKQLYSLPELSEWALGGLMGLGTTLASTTTEGRDTYIKDGVTIQEGDSYLDFEIAYDLGVEYTKFRIYFRGNVPFAVLPVYTVRFDDGPRGSGVTRRSVETWTAEGYIPSEIHESRGSFWPL